ncbi:MAG: GNAT family N-acetyltransferase [Alphaproteobacteria bacterium]
MTINENYKIIDEIAADAPLIEALLDEVFGTERFSKTVYRLREGRLPIFSVSQVIKQDKELLASIRYWQVWAGNMPALLLGPIAVQPAYQGKGLGDKLIRHTLTMAKYQGHQAVVLVGDAPYYQRFGFTSDLTSNLLLPGPVDLQRFLGLELVQDSLKNANGMIRAEE